MTLDITVDANLTTKTTPVSLDRLLLINSEATPDNLQEVELQNLYKALGTGTQSATTFLNGAGTYSTAILNNYLTGLGLTNNTTDPTNDIDIAAGQAADSGNAITITLSSGLTKRLDASWSVGTNQGGLDTGAIANTTYHLFLIRRSDTGVVDVLFSTSASSPTMPTNYDTKRRIGSIVRTGGAIKTFIQDGDYFMWKTPVLDVSVTNPGTSAATRTLTLPTGVRVRALLTAGATGTGAAADQARGIYISDLSLDDNAASTTFSSVNEYSGFAGQLQVNAQVFCFTNTSAQVRSRIQVSTAGTVFYITTNGWEDKRGRDG